MHNKSEVKMDRMENKLSCDLGLLTGCGFFQELMNKIRETPILSDCTFIKFFPELRLNADRNPFGLAYFHLCFSLTMSDNV